MRAPTLAVAILGVAVAALVGCTSQDHANPVPAPTNQASVAATSRPLLPFTAARIKEIRGDLASGDAARVRDAIAIPTDKTLPTEALTAMKNLGQVTFDPATFTDRRDGTATVTATAADGKKWTVFLVQQDDRWLMSATSRTP